MNRIDRLSAILIQLQSKKIVRAKEVAERFQISIRTVYRDIRALEEAGVPIGAEAGVGYFLADSYSLPPVMFTKNEAASFLLAQKVLNKYADSSVSEHFTSATLKIRSVLQSADKDFVENIESRINVLRYAPQEENFPNNFTPLILEAIANNTLLEIEYVAKNNTEKTNRNVEPVHLIHYSMYWHMIAWCRKRKDFRDFRLDRISSMKKLAEKFEKRTAESASYFLKRMMDTAHLQETVVVFSNEMAAYVAQTRFFYGFVSERKCEEGIEMNFAVSSLEYLAGWLLALGEGVVSVQPKALQAELEQRANVLYAKYVNKQP